MALQGTAELEEIPFGDMTVSAAVGFAIRDALERESIEFFLRFKEVGIYGVGILRGREEFPTRGSGEENLHVLVERVWGDRKGGFFSEVEPIWDPVCVTVVNMCCQSIACGRAIGQDIRVTHPVW